MLGLLGKAGEDEKSAQSNEKTVEFEQKKNGGKYIICLIEASHHVQSPYPLVNDQALYSI